VFTQDDLLDTSHLIETAKARGFDISLDDLQELHALGLLLPIFRIDDDPEPALKMDLPEPIGNDPGRSALQAARDGRLRDPAVEGYSDEWPYKVPEGLTPREWWNGYLYSSWQLLDLHQVLSDRDAIKLGFQQDIREERAARIRRRTQALVVLSPRYLPGVIGQLSMPPGMEESDYMHFRRTADAASLLEAVGFDPLDLRKTAEWLLAWARGRDPLAEWLPLIRHSSHAGWFKLKWQALHCVWARIAAEVLLRAHEELAQAHVLEPLPSLEGVMVHTALHDRLGPNVDQADSLDRALGTFDLSPHPRVLMLVEGKTELTHIPVLLAEFGLTRPEQVRVQQCHSSKVNVQLLTRYGITPRLGKKIGDVQLVDRIPTALVVVMDPEHQWATRAQRDRERRVLQEAIREEVELQGGAIGQDDLDWLVRVHAWGDDKYELANFTDDELVPALTELALAQSNPRATTPTWEHDLRAQLAEARTAHDDIRVPMGRMRIAEDKSALAKLLWPQLLAKCEEELATDHVTTPVLERVLEVRLIVSRLTGTGYALQRV
jgi:hypothetical protein